MSGLGSATASRKDTCPVCGHVQANVNNPGYLAYLRPDQRARRACRGCGFRVCFPVEPPQPDRGQP